MASNFRQCRDRADVFWEFQVAVKPAIQKLAGLSGTISGVGSPSFPTVSSRTVTGGP
jgi:hypothetical protein